MNDTLTIIYCDQDVLGALGPNRSIQALGNGATASPWYGPIVVMKKLGLETDPAAYGDMDLTAYRNVVDSLVDDVIPTKITISGGNSKIQPLHSANIVKGVKISCQGDIRVTGVLGVNQYTPVDIPIFDPVFVADKPTSSELLGVPVRVQKIPPHPAWKDSGIMNTYENQVITRLFRRMDPEHDGFGLAPMRWVGSVLVVRDKGKDITPQQVEALCYYNSEHLQERLEEAVEDQSLNESSVKVDELLALFTPHAFRKVFAEFKAEKEMDDASWMTAVSPV